MAWMMLNPQVHNTFELLGVRIGDSYKVSTDCLSILEGILRKLIIEDQTLRTFRRAIGFGENIKNDLIPLLIYVKDDTKINDASKIIDTTIKILVNLTIPVECLLPIDAVSRTDVGRHTIFELNRLLTTSKEAFTDSRSTKAVVDHMKHVVEMDGQLNVQQCDSINNCLCLLRNILHIPENRESNNSSSCLHTCMQNEIIWNLFTQSIDKIIIYLMSCPQKMYWGVTMVQLIALMYKDQHAGTLQKLLNLWLEASLSESSEDNESNTSPPNQGSDDSSPIITSDPTSDSSDNGGGRNRNERNNSERNCNIVRAAQNRSKTFAAMKRVKSTETEHSSSSGVSSAGQNNETYSKSLQSLDLSEPLSIDKQPKKKNVLASSQSEDCGYVTQVENQESISTSSNDDDQPHPKPIHQKPHTKSRYNNAKNRTTALDRKELRRKKLVKRSKTNIINMKGLLHHMPTDEDISNILKEFTVDFLLKGYGSLVQVLYTHLLTNIEVSIDTSHFFWLVTYFLKLATQLELDLEHISAALSNDILSYLVFQGVWLYEELEIMCKSQTIDLKPCLRRLHLLITAIREFLQAVDTYNKMGHLSDEDRALLNDIKRCILHTNDLKNLFLLLLRQYNPNLQSRQYLQDLIVTNHIYLLFLEHSSKLNELHFNMMDHLKQFATVEIMRQYGLLLEDFRENGEFVNNCIFTMMHHIGGDLEHVSTLFQPSILKTFSQIWETDYDICEDWSDLIEYVIHKFINTPRSTILYKDEVNSTIISSADKLEWTQEENDNLLEFYNETKDSIDTIARITRKYEEKCKSGAKSKTHENIIKKLLEQTIIDKDQYERFMATEHYDKNDATSQNVEHLINYNAHIVDDEINALKENLNKENKRSLITWLQNAAIEACFVKIVLTHNDLFRNTNSIMEPSIYYYALLHLPIPVVPWTLEESNGLKHQPFILLLHKLGFYLPVDTGKVFVRIPNFWTADYLFNIAQQLGPIDLSALKFDIGLLGNRRDAHNLKNQLSNAPTVDGSYSVINFKDTPNMLRLTPLPNTSDFDQMVKSTLGEKFTINISSNESLKHNLPLTTKSASSGNAECILIHDMDISPTGSLEIIPYYLEHNSETASVASDLTRMYVSDEEDKNVLIESKQK